MVLLGSLASQPLPPLFWTLCSLLLSLCLLCLWFYCVFFFMEGAGWMRGWELGVREELAKKGAEGAGTTPSPRGPLPPTPPVPCCSCRYRCFRYHLSWAACSGFQQSSPAAPPPPLSPAAFPFVNSHSWLFILLSKNRLFFYFLFFGVSCLWRKKCKYEELSLVSSSSCR